MAIIFDTRLEAAKILAAEGVDIIDKFSEEAKKRQPVKVCVLNLLPGKPEAEIQWLRGLSFSEFDHLKEIFAVYKLFSNLISEVACKERNSLMSENSDSVNREVISLVPRSDESSAPSD